MSRRLLRLLAVTAFLAAPAQAQETLGQIDNCAVSATGVAFGNFTGQHLTSTGQIVMICTGRGSRNRFTVTLSTGSSGTYDQRQMRNGVSSFANTLGYNLYLDPQHTTIWGDGRRPTEEFAGEINFAGNIAVKVLVVYGDLPAHAMPHPGMYQDQITAEVDF